MPAPPHGGYVLTDNWYSCNELFEAAKSKGYHFIGAIKSNRKIYPRGFRKKGIQIGVFARSRKTRDFDLVTVNGHTYYMYTYLGKINGQRKVKITITWPKNALFVPKAMRAYISTDIEMSGKQLLKHYMKRWPIEVYFREANRCFGMKTAQIRSKKAIMRYQYIVMLGVIFCTVTTKHGMNRQRRNFQKAIKRFKAEWIFEQAQNNVELSDVLRVLKVA